MNTATRVIGSRGIRARSELGFKIGDINWSLGCLMLGVLLTAFAIVYFKDLNRRLFIGFQDLQHVQRQSQVEKGRLLLEQGAWSTQARVQEIAQKQLGMITPSPQNLVLIRQ